MGTLNKVDTTKMNEGEYKYLGIKEGIETILKHSAYDSDEIKLLFNIDGLPILKSSGYQLWPITSQFSVFQPFTVELYSGQKKTNSIDFLTNFAGELKQLHNKTVTLCGKSYYSGGQKSWNNIFYVLKSIYLCEKQFISTFFYFFQ